ncbi:protein PALE CRESS, chloroplastic-like isoform X2 [Magnolia sinica]|uniref:protein PALE CRESS, chloroplastic-like isoform X2 n=1 Tax=Magnolia sinica TaxID=86752 RepID=UPI00265B722F|nr:protein PALE CRESS, chloroplastic-like isoform X2 [Magnolia sinica]
MAANAFPTQLTPPLLSNSIHARKTLISPQNPFKLKSPSPGAVVVRKAKKEVELDEYGVPKEYDPNFGLPKEIWDDEWQARQREKTTELHRRRQEEDEEENRKVAEYREVGTRLKAYPEEEVRKARRLVSSFITSAEEVEEKIEEAADKGELTELVLMVIWNRLDLARRDDEKDAIRSLDLLYRRVEMEILKREATPSMRLLNDLLNLHDGFHDEEWLKECRKRMIDTFPREDPFSILVPAGLDIDKHVGRIGLPPEDDEMLLRADFIREVDALLQEVRSEQDQSQTMQGFDPESVATRLKQQEKQQAVRQVEALLDLAITLKW